MHPLPAILAGALLLSWPAILNGYPIVFSDTFGFLEEGILAYVGWNKPFVYGPALVALHWRTSLWPIVAAQSLILSALLWATQRTVLPDPTRTRHLALSTLLAIGSAAPWFTTLVMPDIFAPICVLGLFLLAFGPGRLRPRALLAIAALTTFAIAAHLAHLILAAACLPLLALARWQLPWRPAATLAAALAYLFVSNAIGLGVPGISPYGSVFALARLVDDGPARTYLQRACPQAGYRLCGWKDRLPLDSDAFLWSPDGPVSAEGNDPIAFAPEAAAIVRGTILSEPAAVLAAALRNTARQLIRVDVGDALIPDHLAVTVRDTLQHFFPPAETARFDAGLQARGDLPATARPINGFNAALLAAAAFASAIVAATAWRTRRPIAALAALALVALLANAFATGALSGPHDRYQARIAWLVLLPPLLALAPRAATRPARSADPLPPPRATDGSSDG